MNELFKEFVLRTLVPAVPEDKALLLVADKPLETYFRRAFTHRSYLAGTISEKGQSDYEVLEKLGDRILAESFQLYLFEMMGQEASTPQLFADMEKRLTATDQLNEFSRILGFEEHIRIQEGQKITDKIHEDIFESFVAAIVLSSQIAFPDTPDIGLAFAKRWIFYIYNAHVRDKIDPADESEYIDYRSRVNEVWHFNQWPLANYKTISYDNGVVEVSLFAPNAENIPLEIRGKKLGSGVSRDDAVAKEAASRQAIERLSNIDSVEKIIGFDDLTIARLERLIEDKALVAQVRNLLEKKADVYSELAVRRTRIHGQFMAQLRIKMTGSVWVNDARAISSTSEADAAEMAIRAFITKASIA